jgi:hypothetical protein
MRQFWRQAQVRHGLRQALADRIRYRQQPLWTYTLRPLLVNPVQQLPRAGHLQLCGDAVP